MSQESEPTEIDRGRLLEALVVAGGQAGIGFALTDVTSDPPKVVYVSEAVARISGRSVSDLLQGSIFESIAPDERARVRELLAQRRGSDESMLVETVLVTPAGTRVPIEIGTTGVLFDGRRFAATIIRDISRQRETEAALLQSEHRFRLLVEHGPDGVVILRGPIVVYMSPRAAKLLDLSGPEEAVGRPIAQFLDAEEGRRAEARLAEIGARRSRLDPAEYVFHSADGTTRFVEISSVPAQYERQPAVIAFARDVTERKSLDAQLVKADRMAALGLLSATIAHEINNPLTYVQLGLEDLRAKVQAQSWAGATAGELDKEIEELQQGITRAASIVKDLRIFARTEGLELGQVDVESVLEQAIRIADNDIRHRARLIRDYASVPAAHGNAASLEQVFLNILVNAAQAIALGAPVENRITVALSTDKEGRILVQISDTGMGISESTMPRIFEPLFTTKPAGVGTGLGLSICRNLLAAQGGQISIESKEHQGTTVQVLLPRFQGAPALEAAHSVPVGEAPRQLSVWVVDDEPMIGKLIAQLLADEHKVRATTEVADVLRWLSEGHECDVILCDLMMPGQGGRELHGILTQKWPGMEQRLLIMTGGAFTGDQADFLASLDVPALTKPFDLAELRRLIISTADAH